MTKRRRIPVGVLALALTAIAFTLARGSMPAAQALAGCRIYVASGDDIPAGTTSTTTRALPGEAP